MSQALHDQVKGAISTCLERGRESNNFPFSHMPSIVIEPPKRATWGDLSSNIAMMLASQVRKPPLKVAGELAEQLQSHYADLFQRIDVAPPGFLNFTLHPLKWVQMLETIEEADTEFGRSQIGKGQTVLLEFVSANPTGPLHVGHGRGAALGQAIASLLQAIGVTVSREYYINDAGRQLVLLGESVFARYQERCGTSVEFPEEGYHGDYIITLAEALFQERGKQLLALPVVEAEARCADYARHILLGRIQDDLSSFGVEFDTWFSEAQLHHQGLIQEALDTLRQQNLLFEEEGAWWFRSTQFGDEKDRVVQKQDGSFTYLAADIAYHLDKLKRGFDTLINIWGADHHGYIPRMKATVEAFGHSKEALRIVLVQMVSLLRSGRKIEMSKRAGEFVTLREVLNEVGSDAAKFFFLMRRSDTHLDFDLELAKQHSSDNPVYYVQYAHARLASLFRVALERHIPIPSIHDIDPTLLLHEEELRLMKQLSQYPAIVEGSALALEPHRLTFYLQDLAAQLHAYYYRHRVLPPLESGEMMEKGGQDVSSRENQDSSRALPQLAEKESLTPSLTSARLALLRQVQIVIRNGLTLLGLSSPEKM